MKLITFLWAEQVTQALWSQRVELTLYPILASPTLVFFLNNREFMFNETVQRLYCRLWRNIPWLYRTDIAEDDDIPGNVRLHPGESVEFIIPPHYTHRIQLGSSLNRAKCASEERKHTSLYHCGVWNVSDVRHQDTFTIWTKKKKDQDRLQTSFWCFAKCVSTAMWSKKK